MSNEPETNPAADDPEIAALLAFPPVVRRNKRHDGWGPAAQKGFIAWLAASGNVDKAAQAVGRTQSGAWGVRNALGAEGFSQAWEAALDLFHARRRAGKLEELAASPTGPRHTPRRVREVREAKAFRRSAPGQGLRARAEAARANGEEVFLASEELAEREKLLEQILLRYLTKLQAERTARLEGRIVEADYFVRQLTFIELILDIGGNTQEALAALGDYDYEILRVTATPGSTLLERARRAVWQEKGEADRPPPAPLGRHDARRAAGESSHYDPARDGDFRTWERTRAEKQRLAAEAQREWEARARREAGLDDEGATDNPDPAP